jgi:hypothetical protein
MLDELGNERDIFTRRKAWNEVVELEDETDVGASIRG